MYTYCLVFLRFCFALYQPNPVIFTCNNCLSELFRNTVFLSKNPFIKKTAVKLFPQTIIVAVFIVLRFVLRGAKGSLSRLDFSENFPLLHLSYNPAGHARSPQSRCRLWLERCSWLILTIRWNFFSRITRVEKSRKVNRSFWSHPSRLSHKEWTLGYTD